MQNYGYQGYGYPPYGVPNYSQRQFNYAPQQMAQPQVQQQTQPQMQYEIPIQDVRFVTSEEAKAFIVMPNSKALLIDKGGMAYLKTADNMGQSRTEYFKFEPVNADGSPIVPVAPVQPIMPEIDKEKIQSLGFVTIEDYEKLLKEFDALKRQIVNTKPNVKPEPSRSAQ